jgi:hypothetical protein
VKWNTSWAVLKDVLLTGTGLAVIVSQIFSGHPSDVLLVAGLALTVPSAATHAKEVLTGPTGGPSSSSSPPPGDSPSAPSSTD